jgi:hypothetical protein
MKVPDDVWVMAAGEIEDRVKGLATPRERSTVTSS